MKYMLLVNQYGSTTYFLISKEKLWSLKARVTNWDINLNLPIKKIIFTILFTFNR
jgi:hypothetical protein